MTDALPTPCDRRALLHLALAAVLLRVITFAAVCLPHHLPAAAYADKGDGQSYVRYARAMLGDAAGLTEYDRRVFPGYPALIALLGSTGLPVPWAALCIVWLSAGVAVAASAALFRDARVGWAMVMLLPHWPINSAIAMSEALLLALMTTGLLLANRRPVAAGALLGMACLVRPMACFAALGALLAAASRKDWKAAARLAISATAVVLLGLAALHHWTGDALRGVRIYRDSPSAYVGHLFAWPFESLVMTPIREDVPWPRIPWTWAHVALVLTGIGILWRRVRATDAATTQLDRLSLAWLAGNTLFVLCIGSGWGFRHFPRFIIPAQPALFWALRAYLPRRPIIWIVIALLLIPFAVVGVRNSP